MLFRLILFKITHKIVPNAFISRNYELINHFAIMKLENIKFYISIGIMIMY